eukprot:5288904-Alexandrium_andersonii.AAC.1
MSWCAGGLRCTTRSFFCEKGLGRLGHAKENRTRGRSSPSKRGARCKEERERHESGQRAEIREPGRVGWQR